MTGKTQLAAILNLPEINSNRSYWFVRTNSGEYYNIFKSQGLIAVGWNYLSTEDIKEYKKSDAGKDKIALKIKKNEEGDARPGYVVNQIIDFMDNMKKGDIVIIPSSQSDYFSFGEITGDSYLGISKTGDEMIYHKRRKVKWLLKDVRFGNLDPYLFKLKYLQKTITNLDSDYTKDAIDRTTGLVFVKDKKAHYVMRITKPDGISAFDLCETLSGLLTISEDVVKELGVTDFNKREVESRFNLQSPGTIELISISVGAIVVICGIVGAVCGIDLEANFGETKVKIKMGGLLDAISKYRSDAKKRALMDMTTDKLRSLGLKPEDIQKILDKIYNNK